MEAVNATRMELLLKREEVNSASQGAGVLRNKRDVLLVEFFSALKSLMITRKSLDEQAYRATESLFFALGLEGKEKLNSASFVTSNSPSFELTYKNLLGLKIPEIIIGPGEGQRDQAGHIDTGLLVEETKEEFQNFLNLVLRTLPQELKLKRLGTEIKHTTRKVNSLEKFIIPQLQRQVKFIQEALEEREREDIFRLKRVKKQKGGRSNE